MSSSRRPRAGLEDTDAAPTAAREQAQRQIQKLKLARAKLERKIATSAAKRKKADGAILRNTRNPEAAVNVFRQQEHDLAVANEQLHATNEELATAIEELIATNDALEEREQELRRERNFISAVLDTTDTLIWVITGDGLIVTFNDSCKRLSGKTAEQVRGRPAWELLAPEDRDAARAKLENPVADDFPKKNEFHWLTASSERRLIAWTSMAIRDENGAIEHIVATGQDVTDSRESEERLRQAYKMEAIGQLTGGIAHDFNNLLAIMMMDLELLGGMTEGEPERAELVKEAQEAAKAGADLTAHLLAFSRRQPLSPELVDISKFLPGFVPLLRRTIEESIQVEIVTRKDLWRTIVDAKQLENALINLALNARDAMPHGGTLTISASNETIDDNVIAQYRDLAPGDYVCLSVSDTGSGMSPEAVRRAFEPFFTTKETGRGSGLGLSMLYGFAKQSGGLATIYSEAGSGTTVRLYLPRAREPDAKDTKVANAEDALPQGSETILLVEDFAELRARARKILSDLGYRVIEAGGGAEALAIFERTPDIDLLFTDIVMPGGMDGAELARKVRAERPKLKVLFTSGYAERADFQTLHLELGSDVLRKPYSRLDLARKIREQLK